MKRIVKLVLVAVPALVFAGVLGLTAMGCDDDTGSSTPVYDLSVVSHPDLSTHD